MSDETKPLIIAQREAALVERGVEPYPGSIVDYCPGCKVPVRLSPKSQKTLANQEGAAFVCDVCLETKLMPKMREAGHPVEFYATNEEDMQRIAAAAERAGLANIPLGTWEVPPCEPCESGSHRACFGQGCGCKPCQTGSPVSGL